MGTKAPTAPSSSPASFYTANDSDSHRSTTASSPSQSAPGSYRDARQLAHELKGHCQIFLEEQIYICAINLLNSTLTAGLSRAPQPRAVPVPPPEHIALLGTLIVHPQHTTRADQPEQLAVSALALDYLRNLLNIVGPINAGFRTAFQFHPAPRWNRRSAHTAHASDSDMSDADSDREHDRVRGRLANEASVWVRGQDLWSTVGWAFNTATMYPHRWRYWKAWLELLLDVLDADWTERERLDQDAYAALGNRGHEPVSSRAESIIYMYMEQRDGRQTGYKRIMKALMADGGRLSSLSFTEVFDKEPMAARKTTRKRKREQALDLENDKFGDYFDDDSISSGISEPPTPEKRRDGRKETSFGCSNPCVVESIHLRLRLFKLLSAATDALKRCDINHLYEEFAAAIKVLPLQVFALFVSQRDEPLLVETDVTLTKELFHLLLPPRHKAPKSVDPQGDAEGSLTLPMLEQCYMPSPANTVGLEDNAKLSLVVEKAMQLLWMFGAVKYTDTLAEAAERGIEAREAKAKKRRTGKMRADEGDVIAQAVLAGSSERIRVMLQLLKMQTDVEE